jgi:hypothetical protein
MSATAFRLEQLENDINKLLTFADQLIVTSIFTSLDNDVNVCMQFPYDRKRAPTNAYSSALEYCFSVIGLLSALYGGDALGGKTSENTIKYMTDFMQVSSGNKYSQSNAGLLLKVFRHKLAHHSMPKAAVTLDNGKTISWKLHDPDPNKHLIIDFSDYGTIPIGTVGEIRYDGKFIVVITKFRDDIKDSFTRQPDGYREKLSKSSDLQEKFARAVRQIYDPAV